MFQMTPSGSPLDPRRKPVGVLAGQPDPLAPLPAPEAPMGALAAPQAPVAPSVDLAAPEAPSAAPQLPEAPVAKKKHLNPFDKQHLSQTLWQISKGFAGAKTFGDGLGRSIGGIADGMIEEGNRTAKIEVGGPDNAFEIVTNPDGTRTYKPIAAVSDYLSDKRKRETAPKPKETAELVGDSLYAVEQLDPAQRPEAYKTLLAQAKAEGHDVSWAPPEYSPTFAKAMIARTIGARQGSANAATANYRAEVNADRDASRAITERRVNASIGNAAAANARAAESHAKSMRSAPPSTKKKSNSDLDYLR